MKPTHGTRPMTDLEIYNDSPVVEPMKKMWIMNNKLYKYYARDRASNLVTLVDVHNKELVNMLWTDFIKRRENTYSTRKVAELLNRHYTWLQREIWYGTFKQPIYPTETGKRERGKVGYYTEQDVYEMRDVMAERRHKRKDGLYAENSYIPSTQELTRRMGRGMLTYTRLGDGRFVPIWEETV